MNYGRIPLRDPAISFFPYYSVFLGDTHYLSLSNAFFNNENITSYPASLG
jgi:hypothetical protein